MQHVSATPGKQRTDGPGGRLRRWLVHEEERPRCGEVQAAPGVEITDPLRFQQVLGARGDRFGREQRHGAFCAGIATAPRRRIPDLPKCLPDIPRIERLSDPDQQCQGTPGNLHRDRNVVHRGLPASVALAREIGRHVREGPQGFQEFGDQRALDFRGVHDHASWVIRCTANEVNCIEYSARRQYLLHSKIDSRLAQQTQRPSRRPRRECDTHVLQQAAKDTHRG
jgi:hypothetical protein